MTASDRLSAPLLLDRSLGRSLPNTGSEAAGVEAAGYDGVWIGETLHDPFLQSLRAVDATERVSVGTSVAIAFARSPMTLAYSAWDLAELSQGRFVLGLGSQVKSHIERRFSMPWSRPAARMREMVVALRAIWASWADGTKLDFHGDFYRHDLMTPFFSPAAHQWGPPPVFLAAVGDLMTAVAGEVCDGYLAHPVAPLTYLREVALPTLERARRSAGHDGLDGFTVAATPFVAVGRTDEEVAAAVEAVRNQLAFYASTPAYRSVLDYVGVGELQEELLALTKAGRWSELGSRISDEVLDLFAVAGRPDEVAGQLRQRYAGLVQRLTLYAPYEVAPETWAGVTDAVRAGASAAPTA